MNTLGTGFIPYRPAAPAHRQNDLLRATEIALRDCHESAVIMTVYSAQQIAAAARQVRKRGGVAVRLSAYDPRPGWSDWTFEVIDAQGRPIVAPQSLWEIVWSLGSEMAAQLLTSAEVLAKPFAQSRETAIVLGTAAAPTF